MSAAQASNGAIRLEFPSTPIATLAIVQQCDGFLRKQGVTDTAYPCLMLLDVIKKALCPGNADVGEHSVIVSVERLVNNNFCVGVQDVDEQGVCTALNAQVTGGAQKEPKLETAMPGASAEQVREELAAIVEKMIGMHPMLQAGNTHKEKEDIDYVQDAGN